MKAPHEIVDIMLTHDAFSEWMSVKIIDLDKGACTLSCRTTAEMLNGFGILHGGITYSLSDSALAFAANAYGFKCVSVETSISHIRPVKENELLTAHCTEINRRKSIGIYSVEIFNEERKLVSKFKGTVHISKDNW
jgi:acyl-CoA thioesterase